MEVPFANESSLGFPQTEAPGSPQLELLGL